MPVPHDILFVSKEKKLIITWEDGVQSELPLPYLRSWCPCAGCQGHSGKIDQRTIDSEITADNLEEVGSYALKITFSDTHDAGIYSWKWLHQLCPESPPYGYKEGSYMHGDFSVEH